MQANVQVLEILQSTAIKNFAATLAGRSKLVIKAMVKSQNQNELQTE